jgi:hypothetical protein
MKMDLKSRVRVWTGFSWLSVGFSGKEYSGTSVYIRFGISPTWYTSCLDAKNFVWYTTRVRQNESRDFVFFRVNFL